MSWPVLIYDIQQPQALLFFNMVHMQVVEPGRRRIFSEAWSEMEDVLGRTTFHHVFDHMKALAECVDPKV